MVQSFRCARSVCLAHAILYSIVCIWFFFVRLINKRLCGLPQRRQNRRAVELARWRKTRAYLAQRFVCVEEAWRPSWPKYANLCTIFTHQHFRTGLTQFFFLCLFRVSSAIGFQGLSIAISYVLGLSVHIQRPCVMP